MELLKVNGFDGLADAVTLLMNSAMRAERTDYLGVAPYERSVHRVSHATGIIGKLCLAKYKKVSDAIHQVALIKRR